MEIRGKREALAEGFAMAQAIATTRSTRPVLQNLLLTATSDGVTVSATDMEIGLRWKIAPGDCEVKKEGTVLLSAARIAQIARSVEAEEISIKLQEKGCLIKAGKSTFNVMVENVEDFPAIPELPAKAALEIEADKYGAMIKRTVFAAAKESTRYALNGVHHEVRDGNFELVATDGRRMALVKEKVGKDVKMPAAIVPLKALNQVERLKAAEKEKLKVFIEERQIFFATDRGMVVSRLVEGHFPPYGDVIPKDSSKKATIARGALLSAMKQAALMTSEESKSIVMAFKEGELTISGRSPDEGWSEVKVDAGYDGEPIEIRFNPQFVIDCLSVVDSDDVVMEMKEPSTPAIIKDGSGFIYVVMPIHIV
jgi:DNA polymerase-3 subunit beta